MPRSLAVLMAALLAASPLAAQGVAAPARIDWSALSDETVRTLSSYLQLNTTNPPGNEMRTIKFLKDKGFRVTTNSTFFNTDTPQTIIDVLNFLNDEVKVDSMMLSPAYAYEKAPDQDHFLGVTETRELFSKAFANGNRKRWRLNHSPLFLDFLEGKVDFECTAWGIPSYSLLGWQRPCYLMADGYVKTYQELIETTDWDSYGRGKDPRCNNCMAHCGYEPTAVLATMGSLKESMRALREQG